MGIYAAEIAKKRAEMLNCPPDVFVVDACIEATRFFEHVVLDSKSSLPDVGLALEAIATAIQVADVYIDSGRTLAEFSLAATVLSPGFREGPEHAANDIFRGTPQLDRPTIVLLVALARYVQSQGESSEFFRHYVLPLMDNADDHDSRMGPPGKEV